MSYPWGIDGLDRSRFEAYAKLLRLKNGGQVEKASSFSEAPDEETEADMLDDTDSVNANAISMFDEKKLKRAFLDRLSELVANEKGGYHVSSSLMIEWPDRIDILVARNNGFKKADATLRMLETITSSLRDISRLASSAKRALKATNRSATIHFETLTLADRTPSLPSQLEGIRSLIDVVTSSPTQGGIEQLIMSAHDIYASYKDTDFDEITGNHTDIKLLRDALGFLGRLQTCFNTLTRSAERLSSFQNLRILPVINTPTGQAKGNMTVRNNAWSLAKTFSSLGLALDDMTVESIVGTGKKKGGWTKNKLLQRFDKLKAAVFEVHAEMQVMLAATQHDCTGAAIFKYIGCSKRSCFLCSRAVQNYGSYTTRGCHGKLYNLWTVPELPWLAEEEALKLVQAIKNVEKAMKEFIRNRKTDGLLLGRESTIGGSSVATRRPQFSENPVIISFVSDYLRAQRQGMMSNSGEETGFTTPEGSSQSLPSGAQDEADNDAFLGGQTQDGTTRNIFETEQMRGECEICEIETDRRCQFCSLAWFCSRQCQDQMRFRHLTKCSARSITTADILYEDALEDRIPQDPETLEHYGFARCRDRREQSHLLGLYQGLVRRLRIGAIQLNEWRVRDILGSKIIETFSKLPAQYRGGYFPWFLRNQHILDKSSPPLDLHFKDNPLGRAITIAKQYLDEEDRVKEIRQLEPLSKRHCFLFYAMALDGSHPNPSWAGFDMWYDFGFATCRGEDDESGLGHLYTFLVGGHKTLRDYDQSLGIKPRDYPDRPTCSFNELWVAYETGSLSKLFDQYGFSYSLRADSGLREFLSFPPHQDALRPSVWRLKHFLALDHNIPLGNFPMIEAAAREYGFLSQLDPVTRLALRNFYERLFKEINPLRVHEAKNRGTLLEYAESSLDVIDNGVRNVLRRLG
ncbi:hypothetical protein BBK36DRAFT_1202535 [Trichoderma citrinoviride]|uniref:MYND-type domain-containing protein n=1 Tax=Trichoderma citrinoviride TaxID=58853 RepID=A0A2T4B8S9_9HYPO|nr:hypothetical protein BBK36DRAFT_1202535 [Trichoderma citrinoviride]PTB65734.1 hypothetical protein BBK36DRAFT_1202535 [Trichoderma citrinoviride]